jgi:hypothetical protein
VHTSGSTRDRYAHEPLLSLYPQPFIFADELDRTHYVVCYTRSSVELTPVKLKYLSFLSEAALLASRNFKDAGADDDELDKVTFTPRALTAYGSSMALSDMVGTDDTTEMGVWSTHVYSTDGQDHDRGRDSPGPELPHLDLSNLPPTWEPVDEFNFPVALIPPHSVIPDNLTFDSFQDMKSLGVDGSNSNVYSAKFRGESVVVKCVSEEARKSKVRQG